jgi:hypothetical protein
MRGQLRRAVYDDLAINQAKDSGGRGEKGNGGKGNGREEPRVD